MPPVFVSWKPLAEEKAIDDGEFQIERGSNLILMEIPPLRE